VIRVGRLRIVAGALSPAEGARLAELVAVALGRTGLTGHGNSSTLTVTVPALQGRQSLAELADGIAAAIAQAHQWDGEAG
jgi:hypothetical protein